MSLAFQAFVATCLAMAFLLLLKPSRVFEFPVQCALIGLAWVAPQGLTLEANPILSRYNEPFWAYVTLCFLALYLGFYLTNRSRETDHYRYAQAPVRRENLDALDKTNLATFLFGGVSYAMLWTVDTSDMGTQWTGVITMYFLFASALHLSLGLSALMRYRRHSRTNSIVLVGSVVLIFVSLTFGLKREELFILVVTIFGARYLATGRHPSRIFIVIAFFLGSFVMNQAEGLRQSLRQESHGEVERAPPDWQRFELAEIFATPASEMRQASFDFALTRTTESYEYGANYINSLVNQYFPAFIFGRDTKDSLRFNTLEQQYAGRTEAIEFSVGATRTGFSDSFRSFSWAGSVVFFLIGSLFGRLYFHARNQSFIHQFLYLALLATGLKSITHSTAEFVSSLPFILIIAYFVSQAAKKEVLFGQRPADRFAVNPPAAGDTDGAP